MPDPPAGASRLVRRCHELRRMPLGRLAVEDLRVLVAQDVGTETVLPMALGMLRFVPLLEGDYYPGDLLVAVLRQPDTYWATHRIEADLLREALARLDPDDPDYPVDSDLTELAEASAERATLCQSISLFLNRSISAPHPLQHQPKLSALRCTWRRAVDPDATAVCLHQLAGDGQP